MDKALADVATVFSGLALLRRHTGGKGARPAAVINISDVQADGVAPLADLPALAVQLGPATDRYRVQEGDVLVTGRGTQLKVALVRPDSAGAIASSNLIIVRPGPELLAGALLAFLQSPLVQARLLSGTRSSAGSIALTATDLGRLVIPVPPLQEQRRIVELLDAVDTNYRTALQAAETRRRVGYELARKILFQAPNEEK
jgi:hypothetical protein